MRLNIAVPEPHVSKPVLDAALEAVTRLNEGMLRKKEMPVFSAKLPVRWRPEPPGQEHFDHGRMVLGRGWGDCDDLAPWHAASLRVTGRDRGARAVVRRSGPKRWHAIVQRSDGSIDDPSLAAGMPGPGRKVGVVGAVLPVMFAPPASVGSYLPRPQLALRPIVNPMSTEPEAWQARADLPWHWQPGKSPGDIAMASLHASPVSSQAVVGACEGAIRIGIDSGFATQDHIDRLAAISDACQGCTWEELAGVYGPDHATAAGQIVGSFFSSLLKPAKWVAKRAVDLHTLPFGGRKMARKLLPVARRAVNFVPGVGPVAAAALEQADPLLQQVLRYGQHLPPQQRAQFVRDARRAAGAVAQQAAQQAAKHWDFTPGVFPGFVPG